MGDERRITQLLAEIDQIQDTDRRVTQLLAEVDQVQDTDRRITQILVEVDQDATEERRVTQLLLEVDFEGEPSNMFEIDGVEYRAYLDLSSLEVTEGLEPHGDTCSFLVEIPNVLVPDTIDRPKSGNPVLVRIGGTIHFKGIIGIATEDPFNPDVTRYHCECTDFTRWLDRKLITVERGAELAGDRIKALVAWIRIDLPSFPFGTTHVENGFTVAAETYDYVPLSSVLDEVSEACHYQWYVDFDKEIHFFALEENPSPLNVSYGNELDLDDTGNLDIGNVVVTEDTTQVKNRVYIKGYSEKGDVLYKDGPYPNIANQSFYKLYQEPWDWENTEVEVNGEETLGGLDHGTRIVRLDPLDGATETLVGREGEAFVCLFNMGVRFPTTDLPEGGVTTWYYPAMPDQISMYEDIYSIEFMADRENSSGVHEFMISVPSLRVSTIDPVEAMGEYLLQRYAWPFRSGSFATYTLTGWKPGQYFLLTSDAKDLYDYQDFWKSGKTEKNPIIMYVLHVTKHFFEVSDGVGGVTDLVRETIEFANQPYPL